MRFVAFLRAHRRSTYVATFLLPAALLATPALAQRPKRAPSTEAFAFCRAQEQLGDARACWSLWLEKHRVASTEAELAYAEMRSQAAKAPARLRLSATPSAVVTLDGRLLGKTPVDGVSVAAGEHRIVFVHEGQSEGRTITVTAGEVRGVDVDFEAPALPASRRPAEPLAPHASPSAGEVLDLCSLSARTGARKERMVVFAPSSTGQVNDDARLRAGDGASVIRRVFGGRFATDRFHNVLGSFPGKKGWEDRTWLSLSEVRSFVGEAHADGDASEDAHVERERAFVDYSLGCADYIVVPSIRAHETRWEGPRGDGRSPSLAFAMDGVLGVFRKHGDAFERIALLKASVPSFTEPNAPDPRQIEMAAATVVPRYVSAIPDSACVAGKHPVDGVAALGACSSDEAPGALAERRADPCGGSLDESRPAEDRLASSVTCMVRRRALELARAFEEDSRTIDRFGLFAIARPYTPPSPASLPSFPLGRAEGVKVGDAFEVLDSNRRRTAFLKVVHVGPGGAAGATEPSVLTARLGEAPDGARLDVYHRLGVVVAPYAAVAMLTYCDGNTRVQSGLASQDFTLPDAMFGGGATIGYDVSSIVHSSESYVRVGAGIFTGNGLNTSARLVPIDLWLEKGFDLARRLTLVTAVGGTLQLGSVDLLTSLPPATDVLHVSSATYGPAVRLGLDVLLHPDWSLRLEAAARMPLNSASYAESDGKAIPAEWQSRNDHFATISANVGLAKTF